jgi:ABC-type lipoprotein release transport system permease subunit
MFFTYLRRELRRRRRQALVVALGLGLGIGLVVTVGAVAAGVRDAQGQVLHSLYGVGTDITVTEAAQRGTGGPTQFNVNPGSRDQEGRDFSRERIRPTNGMAAIDAAAVAQIAGVDGVRVAGGGLNLADLTFNGQFARGQFGNGGRGGRTNGALPSAPPVQIDTFTISGVDPAVTAVGPLSSTTVTTGRGLTASDASAKVAVLDASYAEQNTLKVGSTLTVDGTALSVVGLAGTPAGGAPADVYVPLATAQTLAGLPGKVTTIYVRAASASDIPALKSTLERAMPQATVLTSSDLADQVSGSLASAANLSGSMGRWLSIAVLVAAFLLASLFTMAAVARRVNEFGTLKAIGWRSRRVVGQVMGESLVQGLLGGVVGIALGFLGAGLVSVLAPQLSASLSPAGGAGGRGTGGGGFGGAFGGGSGGPGGGGFGNRFARFAQTVDVHLSAHVSASQIALAVLLAIAGGLIAGAFGGWRAARLRPAEALRRIQ